MPSEFDRVATLDSFSGYSDALLLYLSRAALGATQLDNIDRARFGEALVVSHLPGAEYTNAWDPWDVNWNGIKIEVKTVGDHQSWDEAPIATGSRRLSFGIAPRSAWKRTPDGSYERDPEITHRADIWVLLHHRGETIDDNWNASVVSTAAVKRLNSKTIGLKSVSERFEGNWIELSDLRNAVLKVMKNE